MATGGLDYSMFLERSVLCSKEYITDEHITLPHGKRYWDACKIHFNISVEFF